MAEKDRIRKEVMLRRIQIPSSKRDAYSQDLLKTLLKHPVFLYSQTLALYWPTESEIDPRPILKRALAMGKECYLPALHPAHVKKLLFVKYRLNDPLFRNHYGFEEPSLKHRKIMPAWALSLVLLPLVAFDDRGRRLGRGGGHYDKTFAFIKAENHPKKPLLIGLAYECQKMDAIPIENWDLSLNGIATEKRFIEGILPKKN